MSWDKTTISLSEIDLFVHLATILGVSFNLKEMGKVEGRGLNDETQALYTLRRLEFAERVVLERMERHSDCDIDDVIQSYMFDKDKVPKRWNKEIFIDDGT